MEVSSTIKERLERLFPCFYGQGRQSTDVAVVPDGIGPYDLEQCQAIVFVVGNNVDVGKHIDHAGAALTLNNHREVARAAFDLEFRPDRPDVFGSQRWLCARNAANSKNKLLFNGQVRAGR
jgi:hypothetical protein